MSYLVELFLAVFSRVMLFARVQAMHMKPQLARGVNILMIFAIIMPMTFVPASAQVEINQGSIEKDFAVDSLLPENEVFSAYQDPSFAHPEPRTVAVPVFPEDALEPVIYLANRFQMARTYNFYDTSPIWEDITPDIPYDPNNGDRGIYDFVLSPKNPFNVAYIATSIGVYRTENLSASTPTWSLVLEEDDSSEAFGPIIFPKDGDRILVANNGYQHTYYISDDGGDTWEEKTDTFTMNSSSHDVYLSSAIDIAPDGDIYVVDGFASALLVSGDDGDTWTFKAEFYHEARTKIYPNSLVAPEAGLVYFSNTYAGDFYRWTKGETVPYPLPEIPTLSDAGYTMLQEYPEGGLVMIKRTTENVEAILYDYENAPSSYGGPIDYDDGWGGRASGLFVAPNTNYLGWASRKSFDWSTHPNSPDTHFIVSSTDGGETWQEASGNWGEIFDVEWAGSAGTSWSWGTVYFQSPTFSLPEAADAQYACASGNCPVTTTNNDCQENVGNPVNTATGNHSWASTDLSIPVPAGQLSFKRSYSTFNARDVAVGDVAQGVLSPGWYHNYEVQLLFLDDPGGKAGQVVLQTPGGSRYGFNDLGDGVFEPEPGLTGELSYDDVNDTYSYRNTHGDGYDFDDEGRVTAQVTATGQQIEMEYSPTTG